MDQRCHTFSLRHYHQALGASFSILYILVLSLVLFMQSLYPTYNRNTGLVSWIRDAILSRLVTIIKRLVHHSVYCISLSCLLSFLCNPYIPVIIYEIFHLFVYIIIISLLPSSKLGGLHYCMLIIIILY